MIQSALRAAGLDYAGPFSIDDKIHRFKARGDHDANSWYVLHQMSGQVVAGAFGCWKRQIVQRWCSVSHDDLPPGQFQELQEQWRLLDQKRREEEAAAQAEVREACKKFFAIALPVTEHPYLTAKGIKAHGDLRLCESSLYPGWLSLPLQDQHGVIHSAQYIADDGTKKFNYRGRTAGTYFEVAMPDSTPLVVCEGMATGASIHEATGWAVCAAMNCGNLLAVAKLLKSKYPDRILVIAADNDQFTEDNPGVTKATKAAADTKAILTIPQFSDTALETKPTDFNDLHRLEGIESVRRQIENSFPIHARPIGELEIPIQDDPNELLKYRFLSRGGSLLIPGPTGMGKSSLGMQFFACWSNCLPCFGIIPARPLTTVLIQAENDDGDLAEMRNGICRGLEFTAIQRKTFFERVLVFTSNGLVGKAFCEQVVAPLLALHRPDILGIDPALSFLGGDTKEQRDVSAFLRVYLNPLIINARCASVIFHHTNKPVAKGEPAKNGEWAYAGSGSAEWANWARAVLSLESTGTHGLYTLHAAKRGSRLGWRQDDPDHPDTPTKLYKRTLAHSTLEGVICWHESEPPETPGGRPPTHDLSKVADLLLPSSLSTVEWKRLAEHELGVSRAGFYRYIPLMEKAGLILKSKINGKWTRLQTPQNPKN